MRENVTSILKQLLLRTLGGMIDFHIQKWRRYNTSTCTSSRDNYKVSVWLATGIIKYLDTARYGSSSGSSSEYDVAPYCECCVFEHVRELRSFSITV